jgi:predicted enzyme related to lactoylglutathione lyase
MDVLSARTIIHPTDLDRTLAFYGDLLDLPVAREFGAGTGRGVVFFAGGGYLEVVGERPAATGADVDGAGAVGAATPPYALWLQVRSVEETVAELERRGVAILRGPVLEPWGLVEAWIADPDGLRIHLVEVPPDHPLRRDLRTIEP